MEHNYEANLNQYIPNAGIKWVSLKTIGRNLGNEWGHVSLIGTGGSAKRE